MMWQTIGHERAQRFLQRAIARQSLGHATLLAGPQSVGKTTLALDVTAALLCSERSEGACWQCTHCKGVQRRLHSDLHLVELEEGRKTIRVEQIAALQRAVALRPYQAAQRVAIIRDAHLLQPEASQRLLKTLEEPPPYNTLILTATATHLLPATLVSRCQVMRLSALPQSLIRSTLIERGAPEQDAAFLAAASLGRLGWAISASQQPELREQEEAIVAVLIEILRSDRAARTALVDSLLNETSDLERLFELWNEWWRSLLLFQAGAADDDKGISQALGDSAGMASSPSEIVRVIKRIDETREWVRANVNPRLALETLVLHLPAAS